MKNWMWIPLAAIAGLVAGSWGPREDLRLLKERMVTERATKKVSRSAGFDAFAHLANIPDVAKRRPKKAAEPNAPKKALAVEPEAGTGTTAKAAAPERRPRRMSPEDLRARIDEAAELWRTRVELASVQWKGKLGATDGERATAFDSAIATMNESLRETMQAMADEIESAGKMTPELGLRLMGDASRVMAETYDALGAVVPENRRAEVSEMPVFEFIDPSVAEPLIGVQDKLDGGMWVPPQRR